MCYNILVLYYSHNWEYVAGKQEESRFNKNVIQVTMLNAIVVVSLDDRMTSHTHRIFFYASEKQTHLHLHMQEKATSKTLAIPVNHQNLQKSFHVYVHEYIHKYIK